MIDSDRTSLEPICSDNERFSAFPDPDRVFATDLEKNNMLPLAIYRVDGGDDVLLATTLSDDEGFIGKAVVRDVVGRKWVTYSKAGNKWKLDCLEEDLGNFQWNFGCSKADTIAYFESRKLEFKSKGCLENIRFRAGSKASGPEKWPLFQPLGDTHGSSDWTKGMDGVWTRESPTGSINWGVDRVIMTDKQDNKYEYLGYASSSTYTRGLNPLLHFFYCAKLKRVLLMIDFL